MCKKSVLEKQNVAIITVAVSTQILWVVSKLAVFHITYCLQEYLFGRSSSFVTSICTYSRLRNLFCWHWNISSTFCSNYNKIKFQFTLPYLYLYETYLCVVYGIYIRNNRQRTLKLERANRNACTRESFKDFKREHLPPATSHVTHVAATFPPHLCHVTADVVPEISRRYISVERPLRRILIIH